MSADPHRTPPTARHAKADAGVAGAAGHPDVAAGADAAATAAVASGAVTVGAGAAAPSREAPTLRARLVAHIIVPLAATWLLGTLGAVAVSNLFVQRALDRSLLDDALLLASNVKLRPGGLRLDLSSRELSHVLHDPTESVYFAVLHPDGSLVAGHAGLRLPTQGASSGPTAPPSGLMPPSLTEPLDGLITAPQARQAAGPPPRYADIHYKGRTLRAVSVVQIEGEWPFEVVMAQTRHARDAMLRQLLLLAVVPQVLLLTLLAWWLRRVIGRDLQPLSALERAVAGRAAHDLTPLPAPDAPRTDTRDVQQLRLALNELLARIGASVQAQREFAGNVAHELRTPLAGIRLLADYGLAHDDPAVWRAQLLAVQGSEARATHLVDQLLALALADEAGPGLTLEPLNLADHVQAAVLRWLPRADTLGVDLGADLGADLGTDLAAHGVTVPAHPTLIEGVLNNLIDNALRYGQPRGAASAGLATGPAVSALDATGVTPLSDATAPAPHPLTNPLKNSPNPLHAPLRPVPATVTLALREEALILGGRRVTLAVIDNGPGIAPEQAQQWMARWQRGGSASSHHVRGSGLGLAIVGEYARRLGAELALLPAPGGGLWAQLTWTLPDGLPPVSPPAAMSAAAPAPPPSASV